MTEDNDRSCVWVLEMNSYKLLVILNIAGTFVCEFSVVAKFTKLNIIRANKGHLRLLREHRL